MDRDKQKRMIKESEQISQRMEKSRRDIALLQADYARLLERGVRGTSSSNVTDTDKQKEIQNNKRDEAGPSRERIQHPRSASVKSSDSVVVPKTTKSKSYNVEKAREYMRKQKEKRLQQQKEVKDSSNAIEAKKRKLQELHKKSLLIVSRNRERSKSRDRLKALSLESPSSLALREQSPNTTPNNIHFNNLPAKSDDAKIKAATFIQAWFRGHRQRMLYKNLLQQAKQRKIQEPTIEIPEWLREGAGRGNPFTFINSVKRKLKCLSTTPVRSIEAAVQKSDELFTPQRSAKEVRELIEQNLSSTKAANSNKFNAKIEKSVKSMQFLQLPDETDAFGNQQHKLKTKTNASDSDTSNNIPELSSESPFDSYHTSSSSRRSSKESEFQKPIQPPPKPKRVLRNQSNASNSSNNSENILNINTERLKTMKLHRAAKYFHSPPETKSAPSSNSVQSKVDSSYFSHSESIPSDKSKSRSKSSEIRTETEVDDKAYVHCLLSSDSKRQSFIAGNICRYPRSCDKESPSTPVRAETENLNSFQEYVKNLHHSPKITYTPFQPRRTESPQRNPEELLDSLTEHIRKLDQTSGGETKQLVESQEREAEKKLDDSIKPNEQIDKLPDALVRNHKTATHSLAIHGSNEIPVKFHADLHFMNDINQSLRKIENIDKSMLELQTSKPEMRDANTSAMSSTSFRLPHNSSIIEKSINFSRGSDLNENVPVPEFSQQLVKTGEKIYEESLFNGDNSLLEVSDISMNNTTALSLETTETQLDKIPNIGVSIKMFDQIIKDEDARLQNLKTVMKVREMTLIDSSKSELILLEIQKSHLLKTGKQHEASLLKKKQRGIVLKLQEERNEMRKMKQMQKNASKERKTLLKAQRSAIKEQLMIDDGNHVPKLNRAAMMSQRKCTGPVKVYNYQSETSVSRKSSLESVLVTTTSHSESIVSKASEDEVERSVSQKVVIAKATTARHTTDQAKRTLQRREAALQKRKQDAKDLLLWHQKLLVEECKIARLERAAAKMINQVPIAGVDQFDFRSKGAMRWDGNRVAEKEEDDQGRETSTTYSTDFETKSKTNEISLQNGIKESESTLNEMMHNINNIKDEIAELYKLSSVPPVQTTDAIQDRSKSIDSDTTHHQTFKENPVAQDECKNHGTEQDISSIENDFDESNETELKRHQSSSIIEELPAQIQSNGENPENEIIEIQVQSVSEAIEEINHSEVSELDLFTNNDTSYPEDFSIDEPEDISKQSSSTLNVHDEAQIIPVTDVKLKERKNDSNADVESLSISLSTTIVDESLTDEKGANSTSSEKQIDVKKRVSEILADAHLNTSIEEKSPRLPDIYVTTYDVISPENSPELGSPVDSLKSPPKQKDIYGIGNEAQELLKKQLAIEQEIKQIEQQQKENRPYIFREIPNKPPPPYTPPIASAPAHASILPASVAQIKEVLPQFASLFFNGYVANALEQITFPNLNSLSMDKQCAELLFDVCKELACKHYKQFEQVECVAWMQVRKQTFKRPFSQSGLEEMLERKLSQLFGFENVTATESMLMKWSRKKRDHVDELLVTELHSEEAEWTNFDADEVIVKDDVTHSLLSALLTETAIIFRDIYAKRCKH